MIFADLTIDELRFLHKLNNVLSFVQQHLEAENTADAALSMEQFAKSTPLSAAVRNERQVLERIIAEHMPEGGS